jgi:hypothetical protein
VCVCLSGIEKGTVRGNEDKWDKHVITKIQNSPPIPLYSILYYKFILFSWVQYYNNKLLYFLLLLFYYVEKYVVNYYYQVVILYKSLTYLLGIN